MIGYFFIILLNPVFIQNAWTKSPMCNVRVKYNGQWSDMSIILMCQLCTWLLFLQITRNSLLSVEEKNKWSLSVMDLDVSRHQSVIPLILWTLFSSMFFWIEIFFFLMSQGGWSSAILESLSHMRVPCATVAYKINHPSSIFWAVWRGNTYLNPCLLSSFMFYTGLEFRAECYIYVAI